MASYEGAFYVLKGDNIVGVIFDGLVKSVWIPGDSMAIIPEHYVYLEKVGRKMKCL